MEHVSASPVYRRAASRDDAIVAYLRANPAPTIREIGMAVGIGSTAVVAYHLEALERRGVVKRDRQVARGIRLVGGCRCGETCPCHGGAA